MDGWMVISILNKQLAAVVLCPKYSSLKFISKANGVYKRIYSFK